MAKTLVVFYSRSGMTRRLAGLLARALDADLDEIRETRGRDGLRGYLRSAFEALAGRRPAILPPQHHPHNYQRVVVGTPVWAGHVAAPVRSYLEAHRADLHHVAFFCTCGQSGAGALAEMARVLDRAPAAQLAMTDRELASGDDARPARFVKTLLGVA